MLKTLLRLIGLLFSLAMSALTVGLLWLGFKTKWTSDGPAMLFVMIGVGLFGFLAIAGWKATLAGLGRRED